MCCRNVIFSFNNFIFRIVPAFLFFPFLPFVLSMRRIRCAYIRNGGCDKICKRMSALTTWCRRLAGIPLLHSIPIHRFFHPGNGADDPWPTAVPSN
jgi:hypothetical protein